MIDIENKVINTVMDAFEAAGKSIYVTSEYIDKPPSFPACFITQTSNTPLENTFDERAGENHVTVRFRIELYSNKKSQPKTELRTLFQIADDAMQGMKFTRTTYNYLPNYDRTVVRLRADYYAIVGRPQTIDGKTVYQIYR